MGAGNSKTDIDIKHRKKRPLTIDDEDIKKGTIPYIKNVNRYGDSDYDDEVDDVEPVDAYDAQIAKEKSNYQLHKDDAGAEHFNDYDEK
jgi:tetrahydromethanopterin S-methyltransferase subunit A